MKSVYSALLCALILACAVATKAESLVFLDVVATNEECGLLAVEKNYSKYVTQRGITYIPGRGRIYGVACYGVN